MSRSVYVYAGILVLALGASWMNYTADKAKPREGVVVVDVKKDQVDKVVYKSPDIEVVFERLQDDIGPYYWVVVTENKKKKENGQDVPYTKVSKFKASGTPAGSPDKMLDLLAPVMAVRTLENTDAAKLETFGLTKTDTTFELTAGGKTSTFVLGGETYGTKDRYVKDAQSGQIYVVDDELFKPLKFATSRLPERSLYSPKKEEIETFTLGKGGSTVHWSLKNREDKEAIYWERDVSGGAAPTSAPAPNANPAATSGGRDDTFSNWFDKFSKLKSTAYVQDGEAPADLALQFEATVKPVGKKAETVQFFTSGDDWYAKSEYTRGLVKLSKSSVQDASEEVSDILEGRVPPPDEKPAAKSPHGGPPGGPPGMPPGGPPGLAPGGGEAPAGLPPSMSRPPGLAPSGAP